MVVVAVGSGSEEFLNVELIFQSESLTITRYPNRDLGCLIGILAT